MMELSGAKGVSGIASAAACATTPDTIATTELPNDAIAKVLDSCSDENCQGNRFGAAMAM